MLDSLRGCSTPGRQVLVAYLQFKAGVINCMEDIMGDRWHQILWTLMTLHRADSLMSPWLTKGRLQPGPDSGPPRSAVARATWSNTVRSASKSQISMGRARVYCETFSGGTHSSYDLHLLQCQLEPHPDVSSAPSCLRGQALGQTTGSIEGQRLTKPFPGFLGHCPTKRSIRAAVLRAATHWDEWKTQKQESTFSV